MKVYLVRHGEIDKDNLNSPLEKRRNYHLNQIGIMQANELKNKIKDMNFDYCFTSPLIRAWSTAMIIVGDRIEIRPDPRLIERYLGEYEESDDEFKIDYTKYYD